MEFGEFSGQKQSFFFWHVVEIAGRLHPLVLEHFVNPTSNGPEVGEHASQPSLIHIRHTRGFGVCFDRVLSLFLCANKQNGSALGHGVAHMGVSTVQQADRLFKVDDVDAVAFTPQVAIHLGVPSSSLMAEVNARLE